MSPSRFPLRCNGELGHRRRHRLLARAAALADEIAATEPDVIRLQEVSLWRQQLVSDAVTGQRRARCRSCRQTNCSPSPAPARIRSSCSATSTRRPMAHRSPTYGKLTAQLNDAWASDHYGVARLELPAR
ncbi:MAG: hypothetical protein GEV04_02555 [Actinophytocola sp.]|nr:hypothetical protein [Actinophytocola sp.]